MNIKNLRQTYCPICFNKLKLAYSDGEISQGLCYTIKGNFYKRNIKRTEKATELHFPRYLKQIVNKISPLTFKKSLDKTRLKINNKMMRLQYVDEFSKLIRYSMWECSNQNCIYYICLDEMENSYGRKL